MILKDCSGSVGNQTDLDGSSRICVDWDQDHGIRSVRIGQKDSHPGSLERLNGGHGGSVENRKDCTLPHNSVRLDILEEVNFEFEDFWPSRNMCSATLNLIALDKFVDERSSEISRVRH